MTTTVPAGYVPPTAFQQPAPLVTPQKFHDLVDATKVDVIGRDDELWSIVIAWLSRTHAFFLGKPGTGKSWMTKRLVLRVDGVRHVLLQFNKFTTDNDAFGIKSVPAMKEGRDVRLTKGHLPTAELATGDEIFKAGESCLNTLLGILNERIFKQDGEDIGVPLASMICMSNELPQQESEELAAIWDRLPTRRVIDRITDATLLEAIIRLNPVKHPAHVVTWDEILDAQDQVAAVELSDECVKALVGIIRRLAEVGIHPSERRVRECMGIVRARAWLEGSVEARVEHMVDLIHVFWERDGQQIDVDKIVLEVAAPHLGEIIALSDTIAELVEQFDGILQLGNASERRDQSTDLHKSAMTAGTALLALEGTGGGDAKIADCWRRLESIHAKVMTDQFSIRFPTPLRDQIVLDRG